MKHIKNILLIAIATLALTAGTLFAANTFPTTLNTWSDGEVIESGWANSLETKIGITDSADVNSLDYKVRHIKIPNDTYMQAIDNAGTGVVNMFKVNTSDEIEIGADVSTIGIAGSLYFTPIVAPNSASTIATGAAGLLNGTYYYRTTYVTAVGETQQGLASSSLVATNEKIELTNIPVSSSPKVTARKIYRAKIGGNGYNLVTTLSDNTTTAYSDNIADVDLPTEDCAQRPNTTAGQIYIGGLKAGFLDYYTTTALGRGSLKNLTTGYSNTALGTYTLYDNTTGFQNTALGFQALFNNTTGHGNTSVGQTPLFYNTTGYNNTAVGMDAMNENTTGNNNTTIGYGTLNRNTTGENNIALGRSAGFGNTGEGDENSIIDDYAMFLGYAASRDGSIANTTKLENITAIGKNATVSGNNMMVLGAPYGSGDTVNVGIGSTYPSKKVVIKVGHGDGLLLQENSGGTNQNTGVFFKSTSVDTTTMIKGAMFWEDNGLSYGRGDIKFAIENTGDGNNVDINDTIMTIISAGDVGIGDTTPTTKLDVNGGIRPAQLTADPCGSGYPEGTMFYNDTSNYYCYCDGANDVKLHDPAAACF